MEASNTDMTVDQAMRDLNSLRHIQLEEVAKARMNMGIDAMEAIAALPKGSKKHEELSQATRKTVQCYLKAHGNSMFKMSMNAAEGGRLAEAVYSGLLEGKWDAEVRQILEDRLWGPIRGERSLTGSGKPVDAATTSDDGNFIAGIYDDDGSQGWSPKEDRVSMESVRSQSGYYYSSRNTTSSASQDKTQEGHSLGPPTGRAREGEKHRSARMRNGKPIAGNRNDRERQGGDPEEDRVSMESIRSHSGLYYAIHIRYGSIDSLGPPAGLAREEETCRSARMREMLGMARSWVPFL